MRKAPDPSERAETDARFPSGPWTGFWLQRIYTGRQYMRDLWLHFVDGRVTGGGVDLVGEFTFNGSYQLDDGTVTLSKQYISSHLVRYEGRNQDDGMWLWGVWTIGYDRGGFHIWPQGEEDPTRRRLKEELDVPLQVPAAIPV
jgi:hypothetical protein